MKIVGFEKLSLVDFNDKIGSTIFLSSCNFRCPFCHNSSLAFDNKDNKEFSFSEILEYLELRKGKIEAVCVTGGEPTLNSDLETNLLEIKKRGFFIKLDTNGTNYLMVKRLLENNIIDYVAMDIKNSFKDYSKTIGVSFDNNKKENIEKMISFLINSNYNYEFRTTLVEEFHHEESINDISNLLAGAKTLYLQKFVSSEFCINPNLHEVSEEKALKYKEMLSKKIDNVYLRGY